MRRMFLMNTTTKEEEIGPFDVWDGTVGTFPQLDEDGWYVINTCGELAAVAQDVNNGKAPKGMNYKYRLAANLDLNNHTWTPIGGGAIGGITTFTNTFDGAGHIIKNMKITNALYGGLFGVIENINDMGAVRISGITVHGTIGVSIIAGGIAALSAMYSIENCINYCTVVGSQQVGGIVGGIISAPLVSTGFTSIRNCINFGNIIIGGLTNRSVGAGGILGGMLESDAGLQFQIYSCTNYGDIEIQPPLNNIAGVGGIVGGRVGLSTNCIVNNCSNGGSLLPSNLVTGFANPICFTGVTSSDCFYWNGPTSGVGTKVSGSYNSIITSMELSSDLFLNTADEKIKVKVYPSDSYTKPNNPTVGIEITHSDNSKTTTQIPYGTESSFDASDLQVGSVGKIKYLNYFPAGMDFPIEANLYYRRYINPPSKPDDSFDVWDGQITSDPFTGGPDADGCYIIDSAAKMGAFTAKTNYQAYPGWTAFPESYVKVKVTKNIDMNNHPAYCIGILNLSNGGFKGHFDGQGHTIRNVNMVHSNIREVGFFSMVQDDVTTGTTSIIENFQISGNISFSTNAMHVGGVIGVATNVKIQNIVSNISIFVSSQNYTLLTGVGGIVGTTNNTTGNTMLQNCVMLGNITMDTGVDTLVLGGIIGRFGGNNIIQNCTFNGDEISVTDGNHYIGGICGQIQGNGGVIRYCSAYSTQPTLSNRCGGIVGFTPQPELVTQCFYSDGNDNGMGGTWVPNVASFPVTSCILRQYEYPAEKYWMKGTFYPKNINHASDDILVQMYDRANIHLRDVDLPIQKQVSDPEYTLVDFTNGGRGLAGSRVSSGGGSGGGSNRAVDPTSNVPLAIEFKIGKGLYSDGPWKAERSRYLLDNADAKYYTITKSGFTVSIGKVLNTVNINLGLSDTQEGGSYSIKIPLPDSITWENQAATYPSVLSFYIQSGSDSQYAHQINCIGTRADGSTEPVQYVAISPGDSRNFPAYSLRSVSGGFITISGSSGKQNLSLTISTMYLAQDQGGGGN